MIYYDMSSLAKVGDTSRQEVRYLVKTGKLRKFVRAGDLDPNIVLFRSKWDLKEALKYLKEEVNRRKDNDNEESKI